MFSFITTKFLAYACGALLVSLVIAGGFAGCEHRNANEARADRESMKSERNAARNDRDQVVKANQSQELTIEAQNKALNKWAELGVSPKDVKELMAAAIAKKLELERLIAENEKEKEKDNANPDCEKLRRVDFQRVCPHRAGVLRRYENRVPRSSGGSAGAGVRGAPGESPGSL